MTEQDAKQELINQSKASLKKLKKFVNELESAILGDNDGLIKLKATELIFLEHFLENHLSDMARKSFAAYKAEKSTREILKEILQ